MAMFEVVSSNMPSVWRTRIEHDDSGASLQIGPEAWLRDGFWVDLYSDPPLGEEARRQYQRDVTNMMREEGRSTNG